MDDHHGETSPLEAERIAEIAAGNLVSELLARYAGARGHESAMHRLTRVAVLRAFGCRCEDPGSEVSGSSFEDIMCVVHGVGPIESRPQHDPRPEPGS